MAIRSSASSRTMVTSSLPTGRWVPHGYETVRDSVQRICDAYEGLKRAFPDATLRDESVAAIWRAVDGGQLRLLILSRAGDVGEVPADVTRAVPFLRSPRVLSLVYLRPGHPLHREFVTRFGSDFAQLTLCFEKSEIEKLERKSRLANPGKETRRRGRPPIPGTRDAVQRVVDDERWTTSKSLKALAHEVSRELKRPVSDDTVGRTLDRIYEDTGDPRFKRLRRKTR